MVWLGAEYGFGPDEVGKMTLYQLSMYLDRPDLIALAGRVRGMGGRHA